MAVYTYVGNKRLEDWRIDRIVIGRNPDGTPLFLELGDSGEIDDPTYKYLSERFTLLAGTGHAVETPANPLEEGLATDDELTALSQEVANLSSLPQDVADLGGILNSHTTDTTDVHGFADAAKALRISGVGLGFFNLPAIGAFTGTPQVAYTAKQHQIGVGRPIFLMASVAVISEPGQNGHISLQVAGQQTAPNELVAPPDNWFVQAGVIACRNNMTGAEDAGDEVAAGGQMTAIIHHGWWWRLKFEQINGYQLPSFAYFNPASMIAL